MAQALVVAPHPDDESVGCGGTIALLTSSGVDVDVVYMTRGELGFEAPEISTEASQRSLADQRTDEAYAACAVLGVRDVRFLDLRDGHVAETPEVVSQLRLLMERDYSRIFCPWPRDGHVDHEATFRWVRDAVTALSNLPDLWLYEVWAPMRPTTFVPIDGWIDTKLRALAEHRSQLAVLDYSAGFRGLASYRALFCPPSRFAEAFQVVEGLDIVNLSF